MSCEENKEADGACRAAHTARGAVVLYNTSSLSGGAVNVVIHLTALANTCAHHNSNTDDDGSAESEILEEE